MARRVLSSAQTVVVKFLAPLLVFAMGFGAALAPFVRSVGAFPPFRILHMLPVRGQEAAWLIWLLAMVYDIWWAWRMLLVSVDDEQIHLSDFFTEFALPLDAISAVTENRWINLHPVTIEFSSLTPWGYTVKFIPKFRPFAPNWISHPVVAELRELADAARIARRASPRLLYPDRVGDR
jgi:hypothetical protein